jgi:UDP-N-acetylmuramyl pentapeptide phosphotransferase/UDP-N-acetylglucosamine-1-phosphate transferase
MLLFLIAFVVSFLITLWVVHSVERHGHLTRDHDTSGPQKFHARPVPRIGGLGIFVAVLAGIGVMALQAPPLGLQALMLMAAAVPAFGSGFVEDITKRVSAGRRLFFTAMAASLAAVFLDAQITRTAIPGLDWLVSTPWGAVAVTVFVIAGVANSMNIIDGLNGLASMCAALMFVSIAYVAFQVGDTLIASMALLGLGAVLGFFVWNFPAGLIFLGDGGAYFLGFWVAELAVLVVHRNAQVSPLFPLLVCIYPVFETLFSIYRRKMLRGQPAGMPDGIHLHSLIYRRIMRWAIGKQSKRSAARRNSMTSPYLWMLCMLAVVPAMLFWNSTPVLGGFIVLFGVVYTGLYWRIVRFRAPRWMLTRR